MAISDEDKKSFLKDDLKDALTGTFVGAVSWLAHPETTDDRGVRGLGMYTTFLQARALYEFFFDKSVDEKIGGRARAGHFVSSWQASDPDKLRKRYMTKPANNRLFHLVYGRSKFGGASKPDEARPTEESGPSDCYRYPPIDRGFRRSAHFALPRTCCQRPGRSSTDVAQRSEEVRHRR